MQHANGDGRDSRFVSAPCLAWKTLVLLAVLLAIALCFAPAPSSAAAAHSVCSGQAHFCLLNTTSQLYCWGVDSSPPWNALPVPAHLAAVEYSSVRCGRFFTCAIRKREKTVDCFGSDEPDGANGPVATSGSIAGIRVSDLALGDSHGLIISEDGLRVYAWGSNRTGQLAVPTLSDAQLALNVSFRSVAAGGSFSCVLFCFPRMDEVPPPSYPESFRPDWFWPCCSGQLQWLSGDPQSPQGVTLGLPFAVYRDLSCAGQLCCLINMDGVMGCMGINEYAQLNFSLSSIPYAVSVSAGDLHAVAMRLDGTLVAWGLNNGGQSTAPAGVFSSIHAGWATSCAVRADTSVQCFAAGGSPPPLSVARCSTGEAHTCCIELLDDSARPVAPCTFASCPAAPGPVFCFGADYSGQSSPQTAEPIEDAVDIAAGWMMTCVLKADLYLRCWGATNWDADEQARVYNTQYSQITLVGGTLCMLRLDNQQMECSYGAEYAPIPTEADGTPLRWRSIVTLDFHQCGLLLNSSVLCWGNGGWNIQEETPPLNETFLQLMGGSLHVCAISTSLQLRCWGDSTNGASPAPAVPASYLPFRLQPGYFTSSVLLRQANDTRPSPDLFHLSWGLGARGTAHPALQPIPSMRPVRSISFGDGFGCLLTLQHKPLCFGSDHYSQCQSFTTRARVAPRYFFESGTGIQPCAPGTFSLGPGATSALCSGPCSAGRYGSPAQQQSDDQCTAACPPGSACMAGSSSPQPCDPYTYSSLPGASVCDVCSGGLWVHANRTRCGMPDCPPGAQPADNACVACIAGTFSPGGGKPCAVCVQGFSAPYDSLDHCLDCSGGAREGLSCSNTGLTILTGFFLIASPAADTLMTMRCPPGYCEGDASHSVSVMPCSANRDTRGSNLFCASCLSGYDEWNGRCVVCPSSPRWGLLFLLVCVSFAAVFVFHLLSQSAAETAALGTFSYFIQVVSQLGPQQLSFGGALAFLGSFSLLQTSGGLCLARLNPYEYAIVRMMSAPIAFAELGIIAVVHAWLWSMGHCRTCTSDQQPTPQQLHQDANDLSASEFHPAPPVAFPLHRYLRAACCLLLFLYQDIAFTSLSMLTCVGVGGSSLVYFSPGIDCGDAQYGGVRAVSIVLVVVGVVGIPAMVVTVLARKWMTRRQQAGGHNGHDATAKELQNTGPAAAASQHAMLTEALRPNRSPSHSRGVSRSPFAPFDESFHSGASGFQVFLLLRRLLLISLELALLQQAAALRYVCFAYFHLSSLLLHARFRPFLRSLDNDLESFALLMLTALSGSLLLVNQSESTAVESLHTLMVLAPVCVFIVVIAGHKAPKAAAYMRRYGIASGRCGCCVRKRTRTSPHDRAAAAQDSAADRSMERWSATAL